MTAPFRWEDIKRIEQEEEERRQQAERDAAFRARVDAVNKSRETGTFEYGYQRAAREAGTPLPPRPTQRPPSGLALEDFVGPEQAQAMRGAAPRPYDTGAEMRGRWGAAIKEQGLRSLATLTELGGRVGGALGAQGFKEVADDATADYRNLATAIDEEYSFPQTPAGMLAGGSGVMSAFMIPQVGATRALSFVAGGPGRAAQVARKVLGPEITRGMPTWEMLKAVGRQNLGGALIAAPMFTVPEAFSSDPYDSSVGSAAAVSRQFRDAGWEPEGALEKTAAGAGRVAEGFDNLGVPGRMVGGALLDLVPSAVLEGGARLAARGISAAARVPATTEMLSLELPQRRAQFLADEELRAKMEAGAAGRRQAAQDARDYEDAIFEGRTPSSPLDLPPEPPRPEIDPFTGRPMPEDDPRVAARREGRARAEAQAERDARQSEAWEAAQAETPSRASQDARRFGDEAAGGQARGKERERRAALPVAEREYLDRVDPLDDGWATRRRADGRNLFGAAAAPAAAGLGQGGEDQEPWEMGDLGALGLAGAALATRGKALRGAARTASTAARAPRGMGSSFEESLFSRLGQRIAEAPFERGTAAQWKAALGQNVAAGEREWTGVDKLLNEAGPDQVLSREQIQQVFDNFQLKVKTTERWANPTDAGDEMERIEARSFEVSDEITRVGNRIRNLERAAETRPMTRQEFDQLREERELMEVLERELGLLDQQMIAAESGEGETKWRNHPGVGRVGGGTRKPSEAYFEDTIELASPMGRSYESSHWDERNVVAHVRGRTEQTKDGRAIVVEEIQSDWHQDAAKPRLGPDGKPLKDEQGRVVRKGYQQPRRGDEVEQLDAIEELKRQQRRLTGERLDAHNAIRREVVREFAESPDRPRIQDELARRTREFDEQSFWPRSAELERQISELMGNPSAPPPGPWSKTPEWTELGLKKLIDRAIREDAQWVVLPRGQQVAEAMGVGRALPAGLDAVKNPGGTWRLSSEGKAVRSAQNIPDEDLGKYVGPEIAERIRAQAAESLTGTTASLRGPDLNVRSPGMDAYYDNILPKTTRDYLKTLGASVETAPPSMGAMAGNPAIRITPELRERIGSQGQRLWSQAAAPVGAAGLTQDGEQEPWETGGLAALGAALATRGRGGGARALAKAAKAKAEALRVAPRTGVRITQEASSTSRYGWMPNAKAGSPDQERALVQAVNQAEREALPARMDAIEGEREGVGMFFGERNPMTLSGVRDGLSDDEIRKVLALRGLVRGQAAQMSTRPAAAGDAEMPMDGVRGLTARVVVAGRGDTPLTAEQAEQALTLLADRGIAGGTFDAENGALLLDNVKRYTSLDDAGFESRVVDALSDPALEGAFNLRAAPLFVEYLDGPSDYLRALGRDAEALLGARDALLRVQPVYEAHARAVGADADGVARRIAIARDALDAAAEQLKTAPPVGLTTGGKKLGDVAPSIYREFPPLRTDNLQRAMPELVSRMESFVQRLFDDGVFPKEMARDWYEGARSMQDRIAQLVIPELAEDPKRVLYHIVNAIASNGQEVPTESRVGLQVMDQYVRTGRMSLLDPTSEDYRAGLAHVQSVLGGKKGIDAPRGIGPGGERIPSSTRSVNIEQAYARLDAMIQEYGEAGAVERLLQAHTFRGRERVRGRKTRAVDKVEPALETLFGPKIGRYAGDKLGLPDYGASTIDLWMARFYHTLTGDAGRRAFSRSGKLNDNVTNEMRRTMQAVLAEYGRKHGMPPSSAQALAWYAIKYAFRKGGAREKAQAYATLGSATLDALVDPRPIKPGQVTMGQRLAGTAPDALGTPGWSTDTNLQQWAKRTNEVVSPKEGPFAGARFGRGAQANDLSGVALQGVRAAATDPVIGGAVGAAAGALQADEGERLKGAAIGGAIGAGIGGAGRALARGAAAQTPKGAPKGVDPITAPAAPGGGATPPPRLGGAVLREAPMGSPKLDEYALNPSLHTLDPEGTQATKVMEAQLLRDGYRRGKVTDAELEELSDALNPGDYREGDVRNLDAVRVVALARRGKRNRELYAERQALLDEQRGSLTPTEVEKAEAEMDALMAQMIADDKVLNQSASDLGRGLRLFSQLAGMRGSYGALERAAKKVLGVKELPQQVQEALGKISGSASMTPAQKSAAVQTLLQESTKVGPWELATGARRAWLLSALPTHAVNLTGSVVEAGPKQLLIHPVMVAMDKVFAAVTGADRVATTTGRLPAYGKGLKAGVKKGFRKETFQGIDPERPLETLRRERASYVASLGLEPEAGEAAWRSSLRGAARVFQAADDAIMGLMAAMDRPFYEASLSAALAERTALRMMREGLKEGTPAWRARFAELQRPENIAIEDAAMAVVEAMDDTFKVGKITSQGGEQGSSLPAAMISGALRSVEQKAPQLASTARGLASMQFPFVNTPSVLVRKALENTPGIGLGVSGIKAKMLQTELTKLGLPASALREVQSREGRRRMLEGLSRSLVTGAGLVTAGYILTKNGMLTGQYTPPIGRDDEERQEAKERTLTNQPPLTIKVGDRAHSLAGFAQYTAALALGHALAQVDDPMTLEGAGKVASKTARATGKTILDLPMLQGTQDAVEFLGGEKDASKFAARQAGSFIPYNAALAMTARMGDPIGQRAPETPWEIVQERLPGMRQNVPPKVGPFGEITPRTSRFELALAPTRPTRVRTGPLVEGGRATYEDLLRTGYTPSQTRRLEGEDGNAFAARRALEGMQERRLVAGLMEMDPGAWAFATPTMTQRFGETQDWERLLQSAVARQRTAVSRQRTLTQGRR